MSEWLLYDLEYNKLRKSWKIHTQYDDEDALNEYKHSQKAKKRKQSTESTASISNSSKCIMLYNLNGHQSTAWKLSVLKYVKEDNFAKNDLARKIRSECGKEGWEGNTKDRLFQRIKQCINRAVQSLGKPGQFDMNIFNNLFKKESHNVMNRKNSICIPSEKKQQKLIGSK